MTTWIKFEVHADAQQELSFFEDLEITQYDWAGMSEEDKYDVVQKWADEHIHLMYFTGELT